MSLSRAEAHVLRVCAKWMQENKNEGWTSFPRPPTRDSGQSVIEIANVAGHYQAARRMEACKWLESKEEGPYKITSFRLLPCGLAELAISDPALFPEGEQVYIEEDDWRGVIVSYQPAADSAPFLVQPDGERSRRAYRLGELSTIPLEEKTDA